MSGECFRTILIAQSAPQRRGQLRLGAITGNATFEVEGLFLHYWLTCAKVEHI